MIDRAEVAWSTRASNVRLATGLYRYQFDFNPLDPNEPGAYPTIVEVGDWFLDYSGYPFLIEEISGNTLTVYDVNERGNGTTSAYGPYNNMIGYVYRPVHGAFMLNQAQLRKLDASAADVINNIEKGILWKYRGLSLADTTPIDNITNLELENIDIVDVTEDGWQGGKKVKLRASAGIEYITIQQANHGFTFDVVYLDSLTGLWTKALADDEETCGTHIAVRVDDNNFTIINNGEYTYSSSILDEDNNTLIPGEYYFLSQTNPGKLTKVKPEAGITQYILQALGTQFVSINVEEPYEAGTSSGGGGVSKFIDLTDTPSNYEDGKFVVATIDGITYKTPLISDISGLQDALDGKAGLISANTFSGSNTFSGDLYFTGLTETTTSKILYIDDATNKISLGPALLPGTPVTSVQFNNNGEFGGSTMYYDPTYNSFGINYSPSSSSDPYLKIFYDENYYIKNLLEIESLYGPAFIVDKDGYVNLHTIMGISQYYGAPLTVNIQNTEFIYPDAITVVRPFLVQGAYDLLGDVSDVQNSINYFSDDDNIVENNINVLSVEVISIPKATIPTQTLGDKYYFSHRLNGNLTTQIKLNDYLFYTGEMIVYLTVAGNVDVYSGTFKIYVNGSSQTVYVVSNIANYSDVSIDGTGLSLKAEIVDISGTKYIKIFLERVNTTYTLNRIVAVALVKKFKAYNTTQIDLMFT